MRKNEKRNGKALLPIVVFVVLYLGLGILFEYGLDIEMGFYKIPVVVIFLVALLVACIQNRELKLDDKLEEHLQTVLHILFCHWFRLSLQLLCFLWSAVLFLLQWVPL